MNQKTLSRYSQIAYFCAMLSKVCKCCVKKHILADPTCKRKDQFIRLRYEHIDVSKADKVQRAA